MTCHLARWSNVISPALIDTGVPLLASMVGGESGECFDRSVAIGKCIENNFDCNE